MGFKKRKNQTNRAERSGLTERSRSHSSGNLPGHEGLNGRPVCVFAVKMNSCAGKQLQRKRTYITHTFVAFVEGWLHEADGTPFHGSFNPPDYLRTRYSKVSKVNTKTSEGTSEGTKVNVRLQAKVRNENQRTERERLVEKSNACVDNEHILRYLRARESRSEIISMS